MGSSLDVAIVGDGPSFVPLPEPEGEEGRMQPSLEEVRSLASTGTYRRIPVKRELYADGFTTIEATRASSASSTG